MASYVDEDYIDIELGSSPPENREFEFQNKKDSSTTSPADELFYKGTLLPLQFPTRHQMVQELLEKSTDATFGYTRSQSSLEDSRFRVINATIPLDSCNISPSESRRVSSCEPLSSEYPFDWSSEIDGLVEDRRVSKKHCSKNLKQTKQFWLSQTLKASKTYIKSLFGKSGCSDKSSASAAANKVGVGVGAQKKPKCKECQNKYVKGDARKSKNPFEFFCDNKHQRQTSSAVKNSDMLEDGFITSSRRSFSGVIQRHYGSKASTLSTSSSGSSSSSSSFSLSSAGSYELQLFNKSISAELENSIESAIAHCKKSQQQGASNKFRSQSAVCGKKGTMSDRVGKSLVEKNELLI